MAVTYVETFCPYVSILSPSSLGFFTALLFLICVYFLNVPVVLYLGIIMYDYLCTLYVFYVPRCCGVLNDTKIEVRPTVLS